MAGSGIEIPDVIVQAFECLKSKKNAKVLAFRLNDDNKPTKLVVDCIDHEETSSWTEKEVEDYIKKRNEPGQEKIPEKRNEPGQEKIPEKHMNKPMNNKEIIDFLKYKFNGDWDKKGRYIVCDLGRTSKAGGLSKPEVHCIMWNPDDGKIKTKMVIASTFEAFKKKMVGVACFSTLSDKAEFDDEDYVVDALKY